MAQRLLKVIVPASGKERVLQLLDEHGRSPQWLHEAGPEAVALEVLVPAEGMEPLLDAVESAFHGQDPFRMMLLPVEAAIPRPKEEEPRADGDEEEEADGEPPETDRGDGERAGEDAGRTRGGSAMRPDVPETGEGGDAAAVEAGPGAGADERGAEPRGEAEGPARISREELYSDITDISGTSAYYLIMVGLSAVVASVGILRNSPAVVVGAMVIAPLLGPNMALALATTLGDVELGKEAVGSTSAGAAVALAVATVWGLVAGVDPAGPEVARLTTVGFGELFLALAAGAAGVLSISRGTATALVGVMVAVALLPPLVASGLLLGSGELALAADAAILVLANVICVNLAGVVTFLAQGVRPLRWREADRARRATRVAIVLWLLLLVGLVFVIARARSG